MSSPVPSSQEVKSPDMGLTPVEIKDSVDEQKSGSPLLQNTASPDSSSRTPLNAPNSENDPPSNAIEGPSPTFSPPAATATGHLIPRPPYNPKNDALQDPARSSILSSPVYVSPPPPPPFPYNTFSRAGGPQQSSFPVVRLTAPMSPAALQPPVPGQTSGIRPLFSYNVVPRANLSSSPGQQFQPTTPINHSVPQREILHSSMYSQPSVSAEPPSVHSITTGTKNLPAQPQNNVDTKGHHSNAASTQVGSQPTLPSTSINSSSGPAYTNPGTMVRPVGPDFHTSPGMPRISALSESPGSRPALQSSSTTTHLMVPDFSHASLVHSSSSNASNPASFPVQQKMYQSNPSFHAVPPPPQAPWLHPSQPGALQRPPLVSYPGTLPASSLLPMPLRHDAPLVHFPMLKPPMATSVERPPPSMSVYQPTGNLTTHLVPPDHEKQVGSFHSNGESLVKKEDAGMWTTHKSEAGAIYYYNSLTKESTYERPASLKVEVNNIAQPTPVSWKKLPGTDWALVTTNDKKNYYYDMKNKVSSWQLPLEIIELINDQDDDATNFSTVPPPNSSIEVVKGSTVATLSTPALETGGRDAVSHNSASVVSSSALDLVKKKLQDTSGPTISSPLPVSAMTFLSNSDGSKSLEASTKGQHTDNNKDKIKDAHEDVNLSDSTSESDDTDTEAEEKKHVIQFKEMLKERGVAPFSKWEKELPKIVFDPRFKAVPSHATRRTLFEHYVRTRAEEERKEKRAAQKAAIEGFKKLLEEASEDIGKNTDYQTFRRKWGTDPRFEALDRKERELLLKERVLYVRKVAEEKIQSTRAIIVSDFKAMLRERGVITPSSRWSRVKDNFRSDPRYKSVSHDDRETLFNEFLSELKAIENEAERTAKAKKEEQEKLQKREQEMRKRKQREELEMETLKLKVRRKEAEASYQALLVETIKDSKASWTESKVRLEKDPQGRFTNSSLDANEMEKLFREHVKNLYERCMQDFRTLLAEFITAEAALNVTDQGKTVFTSWSEAKCLIKHDSRYSKLSSKDREDLWIRHVEDLTGKRRSKDRIDTDRRTKSTSDHARRSPRSRSRR